MATDSGGIQQPTQGQLLELAAIKTLMNANHKIGLFGGGFLPSASSVWADFDAAKATFSGYAADDLVITGTAGMDSDGNAVLPVDPVSFDADATVPAESLNGVYIWDDTLVPKKVSHWALFNQPVNMAYALQHVELQVNLRCLGLSTFEVTF